MNTRNVVIMRVEISRELAIRIQDGMPVEVYHTFDPELFDSRCNFLIPANKYRDVETFLDEDIDELNQEVDSMGLVTQIRELKTFIFQARAHSWDYLEIVHD